VSIVKSRTQIVTGRTSDGRTVAIGHTSSGPSALRAVNYKRVIFHGRKLTEGRF
jgi:hypothetical protein